MKAVLTAPGAYKPIQSLGVGAVIPLQVAATIPPAAMAVGLTVKVGVKIGVVATGGADTVSVNTVVLLTPPPVAETVIGKLPTGVDPVVLILNPVEQAGLQEAEEKDPVAPAGSPETPKETAWVPPELNVVLIELVTEDPAVIDLSPELAREKLKGGLTLNEALASALGLYPLLKALALMVALFVRVMTPV
jgi:hypothetical protein